MRIQPAQRGDRLQASYLNKLADAVNEADGRGSPHHGGQGSLTLSVGDSSNTPAGVIVMMFELTDEVETWGGAYRVNCLPVEYDDQAKQWKADTSYDSKEWVYFPAGYERADTIAPFEAPPRTGKEATGPSGSVVKRDKIYAILNPASGFWEYLGPPSEIVRFVLQGTLNKGGSASAWIAFADSAIPDPGTNTPTITVTDWQQRFEGKLGDRGYARRMADNGRFEVISCVGGGTTQQELWLRDDLGQESTWRPALAGEIYQPLWTVGARTNGSKAFEPYRSNANPMRFIGIKILEVGEYEVGYKINPVLLTGISPVGVDAHSWEFYFKSYLYLERNGQPPGKLIGSDHIVDAAAIYRDADENHSHAISIALSGGDAIHPWILVAAQPGDIITLVLDAVELSLASELGWQLPAESGWMHIRKLPDLEWYDARNVDPVPPTANPNTGTGNVSPLPVPPPTVTPAGGGGFFVRDIFIVNP